MQKTITVGMTGASGAIYGFRLTEELAKAGVKVHVVASKTAEKVALFETGEPIPGFVQGLLGQGLDLVLEDIDDFFSAIASGSYKTDGMVIAPCSMGTLGQIANGISTSLLMRAADVCLKERRPLILLARETPLNAINLENMLKITQAGGIVFPAAPGFYGHPKTMGDLIDFIVGKLMDCLGIENDLFKKWGTPTNT
ncbi:MAG: UbiX family flavin prenyltransferase [Turicibacter sp.]|nr:UbiX family flavin prenyltransferase [Turicibacter sp.]